MNSTKAGFVCFGHFSGYCQVSSRSTTKFIAKHLSVSLGILAENSIAIDLELTWQYQLSECCSKGCLCKYYAFGRPSRMITSFTRITGTALACCTELALSPGPAQKLGKGPGVTCPYVLCQQSSFGVEESCSSITNYNIP